MKSPRNAGPLLSFAVVATVLAVTCAPGGEGRDLSLAGPAAPADRDSDVAALALYGRKACRFGQRYSTYHRRCVLWGPFNLG